LQTTNLTKIGFFSLRCDIRDVVLLNLVHVRPANLNPMTFWKNKSITVALYAISKYDFS